MLDQTAVPGAEVGTASAAAGTIAGRLAAFAHDLRYEDIPEAVRERAKHLILDSIGIALAANTFDFSDRILAGIRALGGEGSCSIIGRPDRLPLRDAVLMNGALVHGLDYDDTHMRAIVHATAGCLPVALGVAEETKAHGRDLLTAYVVGMETAIRIGAAAKGGFHHVGFHATGVVAHFAGALIAGRLYGLSAAELAAAQGIAASTAAAVQVFLEEGTWSKRIHPGWGGVGGITAVRLAQHGFLAPSRPYEGRYGLFDSHLQEAAKSIDYDSITAGFGDTWEVMEAVMKPYPVCHFLHTIAEAACDLHAAGGFTPEEVAHITVLLPKDTIPIVTEPLDKKRRPTTDYEAKFSAQYVAAAGLVRGRFGLAELQDDALRDETILALAAKVAIAVDQDAAFPQYYSGGVVVRTAAGREFRCYHSVNKGAGPRRLSDAEIVAKYDDTAIVGVERAAADRVREAVLDLDRHDAAGLWQVLVRP